MNIPMLDLKARYQTIKNDLDPMMLDILEQGQFILGPHVKAFEKEVAKFLGVKHALGVASGTDALQLALATLDLKPGDEVITTPFTFFATAEVICYFGAKPVFVDVEEDSFNIDPALVEKAITSRTKAILPVHIFGKAANMIALKNIAQKHKLALIEDCAQSFGTMIDDKHTGSFGEMGCYSFFPTKNLGCYGDGGLITCNSDSLAEKLGYLRNHGSKERYHHHLIGYNSRLDELQAAVLRLNLKKIKEHNDKRNQVAKLYQEGLADLPLSFQKTQANEYHAYHQFTLLSDKREQISEALKKAEIGCAIYYPIPLHKQDVFGKDYTHLSLPVADSLCERCISLPMSPELTTEQVETVIACIRSVF